ncbi:hypothetical protein K503DRAFT_870681 [Rhizopogon vinicolor AM-OR11-026]|uniref:RBR-type E3 ubiquitin transferase n=1 Tax=Rhizopogon vinicolor AM-OR11-026 TaxID=1314800 RepID=A0A1B7MFC8_9AGAM|nr:hypothetical protein K503DRAFT_870681 [Rhizopogon vinicolor AM-OR11-026]
MNIAGPSRLRPLAVPEARDRANYEEDLTRLVAELDLADIERLQAVHETRLQRGQGLSDRELALLLLMQNAREIVQLDADHALALALGEGEDEEPDPAPTRVQPQAAVEPQPAIRNADAESKTQTWGQWFASLFPTPKTSGPTPSDPRQEPANTARAPRRATGHDCVICQDPIFGAEVRAPCGHFYGIDCITDLFQAATRDESLYPPRCCRQNIPLPQVRPHLTQALFAEFELKAQEFGTLKRVYCATPACSRFLGPLYEGFWSKVFTCTSPTCTTETCGSCRGRYEGRSHNCTPDADIQQVLTLSRTSGWSRCPGCAQMIELNMGCYHMTCRCRTEFCYLCRARWKSCGCPQWDETRLLAAAEQRVNAQLQPAHRAQPANPPRRALAVHQPARLAADAARNQPVNPPRQAPAAAPRPAPVVNIRPVNPPQQVPAAVPRPAPVVNIRPVNPHQQVPATVPRPAPVVNTWPTVTTHRAEAPAPAPNPAPAPPLSTTTTRQGHISGWVARVPETRPTSTANIVSGRNADRERMIRETMERLRIDHDCQHTTWKYRRGGGRCENCSMHLPLYLFRCGGCEMLSCNRCRRNRL